MSYKQVIVVRTDLGMSTGKLVAQACHGAVGAFQEAGDVDRELWQEQGAKKVAVQVSGEQALLNVLQEAQGQGVPRFLVTDAGETEVPAGTKTVLGLGPADETAMDRVTKGLDLL